MVLAHNITEGLRTKDIKISQDVTFDSMLLASNTLEGLKKSGFYKPSPIQLHGIPLGKCGFDLLLEAKSGTGKTAVFSVITLEKIELDKGLQAVILAPTREIAAQICDVIKQIGVNYEGLVVEVVMGGLPVEEDIIKFKKNVHIVVGSPGRLRHLMVEAYIDVSSVRLLVLDEADKLIEKSFLKDINYIFSLLPSQKQVIMSSATFTESAKTFIQKYVNCAQHVCPDSNCILLGVEQKITSVKSHTNIVRQTQYRFEELLKILSKKQFKQCLIFCNYQARVYELYKLLNKQKWPVEQLRGSQEQTDRLDALKTLQEYKCRILIATDLAARGIDASNVDLVINFEPPYEWQTYLHRIGRAGRYGSYGMAITILSEGKEQKKFKQMIESINMNIFQITYFWTLDNFIDSKDILETPVMTSSKLSDIAFEVDYSELWKELSSDTIIEKNVEDFDLLCKSFEDTKLPEIQSFTELINSFNTIKDNVSSNDQLNDQYILLKPKVMNTNNHLSYTIPTSLEKSYIKSQNPIENTTVSEKIVKQTNDNEIHNNINYLKEKIIEDKNNNLEGFCGNDERLYCNQIEDIETQSFSRALINAGLPASFGSSKKNVFKPKFEPLKENKLKNVERKTTKLNHKNNTKQEHCNEKYSHNHKIQETYIKSFNCSVNKKKYGLRNDRSNITNQPTFSKKKSVSRDNQAYINWYNQLKDRVKYIELVSYINEISRL